MPDLYELIAACKAAKQAHNEAVANRMRVMLELGQREREAWEVMANARHALEAAIDDNIAPKGVVVLGLET